MDMFYIPALASFSGSASGTLASIVTGWVTQRRKDRVRHTLRATSQREELYKNFIGEASRLYADALVNDKSEVSKLVDLYAFIARMKILSSDTVIEAAEKAGRLILDTYLSPNRTFVDLPDLINEMDPCAISAKPAATNCSRQSGAEMVTMPPSAGLGVHERRRPSPSPIRFTSCQEKVDAFAHETGNLLSKMFRVLPHQSSHQHWEQNEVHENLRGGETSLGAERPLWTALKHVGRILQDMRDGSCSPISACLMDMAAQGRESVSFGHRDARYPDGVLKESLYELGADTCELVRH